MAVEFAGGLAALALQRVGADGFGRGVAGFPGGAGAAVEVLAQEDVEGLGEVADHAVADEVDGGEAG